MQAVIGGPVKHLELNELHTLCIEKGGSELSRLLLVTRLIEYFGNNLVALSSPDASFLIKMRVIVILQLPS